ncbi:MAG: hypothetical protein V3T11_09960 [Roseateles sp.]
MLNRNLSWAAVVALLLAQIVYLQTRDPIVTERVIVQAPVVVPAPAPVVMSPPYNPDWDKDDADDRSAYERRDDEPEDELEEGHVPTLAPVPRPDKLWRHTEEQGVMWARLCASESKDVLGLGKGDMVLGCRLIGHVIRNNKKGLLIRGTKLPAVGYLSVMRQLSPHVTRKFLPKRERQKWTSTLQPIGEDPPDGWVPERDGDWRIYSDSWVRLRAQSVKMWTKQWLGKVPGGGRPKAWDRAGYESTRERLCKLDDGEGNALEAGGNLFWGFKGDPACCVQTSEGCHAVKSIKVATMMQDL